MIQDFFKRKPMKAGGSSSIIANQSQVIDKVESMKLPIEISILGCCFFITHGLYGNKEFPKYTRYTEDWLKNKAGNYLMSWPLDSNSLPGESGNIGTISSFYLESLNLVYISGNATETSTFALIGSTDSSIYNNVN